MDAKTSKGKNHKLPKIIAPGELGKMCGNIQNVYPKNRRVVAQQEPRIFNNSWNIITSHTLIMHFEDQEFEENNFSEDCSFLDILEICKKFIDIYSVGFKVTDGDGKSLRNDVDVMRMMKEHEYVRCIYVYLDKDQTAKPLSFKMPQDNLTIVSNVQSNPKVIDLKILGDLKAKKKIKVCGTVTRGIEEVCTVQFFICMSQEFDVENDLQAISQSMTKKEFCLPIEAVGHYVVAKYTPVNQDGDCGESVFVISDNIVETNSSFEKERKVRGENKNKKVAGLRSGEKLDIVFYNNRAVGRNHQCWSRHLGKIVRDRNICPVRVESWREIGNVEKQHMWEAVKECFDNPNIELYRDHTLEHMCALWTAWRSKLNIDFVKPCKTRIEALKKVPRAVYKEDWEWLVTKKFLTEKFLNISDQNSKNRSSSVTLMPHLTGSQPHRDIIYEKGGKDNQPPDMGVIFFETRKKNGKLVGADAKNKYDEIVKTVQSNPSLSTIEVVEKNFGPQSHGHIYGYGGGVKRKTFKDSDCANLKELQAKLHKKEEENRDLKRYLDEFESRLVRIERGSCELPPTATTTNNDLQQDA